MFVLIDQQTDEIDARIKEVNAKHIAAHNANEVTQRLVTIRHYGANTPSNGINGLIASESPEM